MNASPSSASAGAWSAGDHAPRARASDDRIAALVLRAADGDQVSWDALVEQFTGLIWAMVRAYRLRDADAADVVQETWLRLVESLDKLHDPARVGGWLATTARRECMRVLRTQRRQVLVGDDAVDQESPDLPPGESLIAMERYEAVWRGFSSLRERDQALLRLLIADPSPTYEEISAALDMPIGSIGPSRQRALERLRRALESQRAMALLGE
jgi:RNA polymerase sigma factor (sigma-70 family)